MIVKTTEDMKHLKSNIYINKIQTEGHGHGKARLYCLGINIEQDQEGKLLRIHQQHYMSKLIEKYSLISCKNYFT